MRLPASRAALGLALWLAACGSPPSKEMDQAQGAIDAARAAGAERYAADEYTAARTALDQADAAVQQRDYRLALNYALDSREHAQNAAREAADTRARVRSEVERAMVEVASLAAEANSRVSGGDRARIPRAVLRDARQALAQINADVQKAGAALKAEDYLAAQPTLNGLKERIQQVLAALNKAAPPQSSRRRR